EDTIQGGNLNQSLSIDLLCWILRVMPDISRATVLTSTRALNAAFYVICRQTIFTLTH
ncbi:32544_t:CDS:1, partial [Racocetra persica]